ncbi:translation elongation factor 2 [Trichonephila inaurata madagascariensis]|uniref:Translation elongation factor 2 n=1 Tax=Trichonephila inaurata madagascariensis TaxID=2747483 RepID=A0A8X6XG59_9ARAC|nr:translation elongation factor 2 [Trichonephila inaurata madagascariensis]
MYESKDKTITPNFMPVKKGGLHVKDEQITVTVSSVEEVPVELQHLSHLPKFEDDLKRLGKLHPVIQCITEEPGEYIVAGTEELYLEFCLKDLEENHAYVPLRKTEPAVVVPESMPKELKRLTHEKKCLRIKENTDYYSIPKPKQKIPLAIVTIVYC